MNFIRLFLITCFFPITFLHASPVFQPQFKWSDQTCTQQGTGSFIRAPSGNILGLTSAHFLNFSGPQLLEVDWLDIQTKKVFATSVKSWGMPGHEGDYNSLDLRSDYLLMVIEGAVDSKNILDLDSRTIVEIGERVLFPNKNAQSCLGYDLIEGTVSAIANTYLLVTLDLVVDLQSRSGTPIISQHTGKVIGILTGGEEKKGHSFLYLTPSSSIYKAMLEAQSCPLLQNVIGCEK